MSVIEKEHIVELILMKGNLITDSYQRREQTPDALPEDELLRETIFPLIPPLVFVNLSGVSRSNRVWVSRKASGS